MKEMAHTPGSIFAAIAHGDQEHRDWLLEALEAIFAGNSVPPPRGKGSLPTQQTKEMAQ